MLWCAVIVAAGERANVIDAWWERLAHIVTLAAPSQQRSP